MGEVWIVCVNVQSLITLRKSALLWRRYAHALPLYFYSVLESAYESSHIVCWVPENHASYFVQNQRK